MLKEKNVLVVEDDPVFRSMLVGFLHSQGCEVQEASDGREGLQALKIKVPDLLLCDLAMPVMSGMEFVEKVSVQYPNIPIIVISGTGEMADVALALRRGVKDFLLKPIENITTLQAAIISVFKTQDNANKQASDDNKLTETGESDSIAEELEWHIQELKNNPQAARALLIGLMPEIQSRCADWQLNYCVLQSADALPVILDYSWLVDGSLVFYLIDTRTGGENAAATALLIRSLFNNYLRSQRHHLTDLNQLVALIEDGILDFKHAKPIKGVFGMFNASDHSLMVLSTGIGATLQTSEGTFNIESQAWLGEKAKNNTVSSLQLAMSGGRLSLSQIHHASFSVNFKNLSI